MKALLNKYRTSPSRELQCRIVAYRFNHPFAELMLTEEDLSLLLDLCKRD